MPSIDSSPNAEPPTQRAPGASELELTWDCGIKSHGPNDQETMGCVYLYMGYGIYDIYIQYKYCICTWYIDIYIYTVQIYTYIYYQWLDVTYKVYIIIMFDMIPPMFGNPRFSLWVVFTARVLNILCNWAKLRISININHGNVIGNMEL